MIWHSLYIKIRSGRFRSAGQGGCGGVAVELGLLNIDPEPPLDAVVVAAVVCVVVAGAVVAGTTVLAGATVVVEACLPGDDTR